MAVAVAVAVAETPTEPAEPEEGQEVQEVQAEDEADVEVLDDAALMALSVEELKEMVEAGRGTRRPKKRT